MRKILLTLLLTVVATASASAQQARRIFITSSVAVDVGILEIGSGIQYHQLTWNVGGTLLTCTVELDNSADNITWSSTIISGQTCTSNGQSAVSSATTANYVRINVTALTTTGGSVTVTYLGYTSNPGGGGGTPGGSSGQVQYNNAGAFGGIAGSAVTTATGATALTAGADTTTPVTIKSHSATQSATQLDISNQSTGGGGTGTLAAPLLVEGQGFGAFNPTNITTVAAIQQESQATAAAGLIITNKQAVGSSNRTSTLQFNVPDNGIVAISGGNAVGDGSGSYSSLEFDANSSLYGTSSKPGQLGVVVTGSTASTAQNTFTIWNPVGSGGGVGQDTFDICRGTTLGYCLAGFDSGGAAGTVSNVNLYFSGTTSGTAKLGVAAAAGTPCRFVLPTVSPTAGQLLSSAAPSSGDCLTSWTTPSAGTIVIPVTVSGATSGGIPCFDSTTDMNTSAAITVNDAITGGGTGACVKDSGVPVTKGAVAVTTNVAVGAGALAASTSNNTRETAVGQNALNVQAGASAVNSTAIGNLALANETGGTGSNTAVGENALGNVTSGNTNTGMGQTACVNVSSSNGNSCFGANTATSVATDTNELVLGANVTGAGSNTATIGNVNVTDTYFGSSSPAAILHAKGYNTATNCSSSAAPAVCASAAAGSVVVAAAATTVTVNTTVVTANSQIFLLADDTLGTKLSVTCNSTLATLIGGLAVTARTAGTSFQITSGATPAVNPLCLSYLIVN